MPPMTDSRLATEARLLAQLPSGHLLSPGVPLADAQEEMDCRGPDEEGRCPTVQHGRQRLCVGAEWFYAGHPAGHRWRFDFLRANPLCPVAVLDPLGDFAGGRGATPDPYA